MKFLRLLLAVPLLSLSSLAFADCSDKHARKDTKSSPPVTDGRQLHSVGIEH